VNFSFGGKTDVGKVRKRNEDFITMEPDLNLFVVADGMGGYAGGDVASQIACASIARTVRDGYDAVARFVCSGSIGESLAGRHDIFELLKTAVINADKDIHSAAAASEELKGMGSTVVACLFACRHAFIVHVGDSRACLIRGNSTIRLTTDHSLVQGLVNSGMLSPAGALDFPMKNVLTNALGTADGLTMDAIDVELLDGDRILLCSDGLTGLVRDDMIARLGAAGDPEKCAEKLVAFANAAGGNDNISVVIVQAGPDSAAVDASVDPATDVAGNFSIATVLRKCSIFRGLSLGEWLKLYSDSTRHSYVDNEVIFRAGEPSDGLYCVLEGSIDVMRGGKVVQSFPAGSCLGEMSLVEEKVRQVTGIARGRTTAIVITRSDFLTIFDRQPLTVSRILYQLQLATAAKLRDTRDELGILKTFVSKKLGGPTVN
jgi:protein phosphatase